MSCLRVILTCLTSLCPLLALLSQPVCTVTRYDESSGLSQWRVTQMLQDQDGMIWMATWNGLDRFDGLEFTNFKSRPGDGCAMPSDRIRDLRQTADGSLFCLAEQTWYRFDRNSGSFFTATADQTAWLQKGPNGRGAVGTAHRQVEHRDRLGRLWTVDKAGKLSYSEDGAWHDYPLDKPLEGAQFFMSDRQGNLWLLMKDCVVKLSFAEKPVSMLPQERPAQARCLFLDGQKRYWVCTREDATVRLFDAGNRLLGYLTPSGTLSSHYASFGSAVYCMAQTADGTLWLGSKPDGLFALSPQNGAFTVRHLDNLLPNNDVYDIKEDRHHRLWIATMGGGLCCVEQPLSDHPRVVSSKSGFRFYPHTAENRVRYIHITADQTLLAATTEGLLVGRIPDQDVAAMTLRLHQREANRQASLSSNAAMHVVETADHRLFVSTESGGVSEIVTQDLLAERLDFRHYNQQSGLASDIALSMAAAGNLLWIVSSQQLMMLHAGGQASDAFGEHYFHTPCHFSEAHPLRRPDGRWMFALNDGVFVVSDSILRKSSYVPPIALTAIDRQQAAVDYAVNHLRELVLGPSERSVIIVFTALDYENPGAVSYAFRMDDETEWHYIGHNHTASFAGLSPGTYRLLLRSTNGDGVWVDNVRELTIVVTPTFWESWTGRLLMTLLIGGLLALALYTYYYIRRMKRRHHETLEAYLALVSAHTLQPSDSSPCPVEKDASVVMPTQLSASDEAFMARVMDYVETHIGDADANIGDMATATATSRSGLNRKMKSLVGLTPADFLREARIKRAAHLLRTTDDAVADIAFACGFTDPKYFGKCFKATTAMSPTEYRNAPSDSHS